MSQYYNQRQASADVYPPPAQVYPPPPPSQQGPYVAPPPLGYPMKNGTASPHDQPPSIPSETKQRGDFCRGCCAGLCCCCLLDACF